MTVGELRSCPECRRPWPKGSEYDLRGFRWLDDLPRRVSPSNIDCILHDGAQGRSRFLVLETKRPDEDVQAGQAWLLRALAALSPERLVVRILRGTSTNLSMHAVTGDSIDQRGVVTSPDRVRRAVVSWLNGSRWRDAESIVATPTVNRIPPHPHAWSRVDAATWRCVTCGTEDWETARAGQRTGHV